ncbi:MAG: protein-L-isoaspartate(D-aspartate) O-methyltransferase [Rhodospirillales bacterium]|nr:protein-L-isoaspartate(D-aspartate) O-methyltransferase [Rhodospirillales bacterium]MDH3791635.1 protein-L-isoaspartate(D-aspartate) O-methyltransferase [Rhodospirillales bacterium]MDH3910574.1 protein-L-isoaspartate(D-aspartate) O-methyltransferase [Rhodospirillales bacterium]MDH3917037.1 protein-L-isoaspartate(D-aspartate) O-methyltransferase [Rhodospirillales bacterium]MDH3966415.1 protein-L-isoaspartate(D-aspartate) O-methyltransferase [Rhodospirillales bacterium]
MTKGDDWAERARRALVRTIAEEVIETENWLGKRALDPRVMEAMAKVPRHEFVAGAQRLFAYENRPLPIGHGQTISQPYMVAVMTDLSAAGPGTRVLEVGTGCGYQAAVLGELGARVTSVELVPELAEDAARRLERLGYDRVDVHQGDGARGWPPDAPYEAIVVTAAAFARVPPALLDQLAPGGRLVIPVEHGGARRGLFRFGPEQELLVITKDAEGRTSERGILPVAFVPLVEGKGRPRRH